MAKKENKDTLYKLARITEVRPRFFRSLKNPKKMLELGCGHGPYTLQVQRYHPDVKGYGVDILDPSQAPEHLEYLRVDLNTEDLPYDDDMFDLIVFTHVMEHLEDPIRLGPQIHRILKPGGSIFVETPNWTTMFMPSFGIQRHKGGPHNFFDDLTHLRPCTKQGLYEFVSRHCNLNVGKVGTVRNWFRVPLDLVLMAVAMIVRKRTWFNFGMTNAFGWAIYCTGTKAKDDAI